MARVYGYKYVLLDDVVYVHVLTNTISVLFCSILFRLG